jgi:uncharacterized lipoprotein YbaY
LVLVALCLAASSGGCGARSDSVHLQVFPPRTFVRGFIVLREGTTFPAGARLRITVGQWENDVLAQTVVDPDGTWPVSFALPVDWPEAKVKWDSSVRVHARAELNGRTVAVTETRRYEYRSNLEGGKPIELVLHPAIE